ncbi:lactate racemase domain-containing protein [Spirochaetia bacterium 38H-sp]|uniref:Lactate racemase domain-containing protein n=1 Tax=Rarispira pelagica TaxID=3141764 RepID=A0ABU9UAA1_9SPIR
MIYFERGGEQLSLSDDDLKEGLYIALERFGKVNSALIVPPDITRLHSKAGELSCMAYHYLGDACKGVLPALGTHVPMTYEEKRKMYPDIPLDLFIDHNWRTDVVTLGEVPAEYVREVSEGKVSFSWPAQVNYHLLENHDLILSIGQVVPHEVIGLANYTKNIFVGTGGSEGINKSHYLGAVYGMERMMGRIHTPVRKVMGYAASHFCREIPILYVLTVLSPDDSGRLVVRGLYIGDDDACFEKAASLSQQVNITYLDQPVDKVVVYLDPHEYRSTWLGNKSIYRTRMAIADRGELIVLAPGVKEFGEDATIDRLIRKHGYKGTPYILAAVEKDNELRENLSAPAHLIHGSSEGRFTVTYAAGGLSKEEVESVGFNYMDSDKAIDLYMPEDLNAGWKEKNGERYYFIPNPGVGLWAWRKKFWEEE